MLIAKLGADSFCDDAESGDTSNNGVGGGSSNGPELFGIGFVHPIP